MAVSRRTKRNRGGTQAAFGLGNNIGEQRAPVAFADIQRDVRFCALKIFGLMLFLLYLPDQNQLVARLTPNGRVSLVPPDM